MDHYLIDAKGEVRKAAIEIIAGLSVDDGVVIEILAQDPDRYVSRLFSKVADLPPIAALAWDALTNLATDRRVALHLFDHHKDRILKAVASRDLIFTEAATKLMANISKHLDARPETIPDLLKSLLPLFKAGPLHNPHCNYDFIASIIADLSNTKEGRLFFLEDLSSTLEPLLPELYNKSVIRRGGIASLIKNCLFETNWHAAIFVKEKTDDFLITTLAGRLLDAASNLDEGERDKLPVELQLLENLQAESDLVIRSIIIESFIILATTREGRDVIRSKGIYPIFREWHKLEPVGEMKRLIEKMVELIIRDEQQP